MNFFEIPVVATAISVIICWALFGIFCSIVHEAVSQIRDERGRFMKKWLMRQLLDRPNGVNWGSLLYMHGSIDLLQRSTSRPAADIDSKLFAETIIEVVGRSQIVQIYRASAAPMQIYKSEVLDDFKAATLVLKRSDVVSFFQKAMHSAELCVNQNGKPDEAAIYECLVKQIEHWYGEMCSKLSSWYGEKTKKRMFALGLILAVFFNVNSFELFTHFQKNTHSRETIIQYYENNVVQLEEMARHSASGDRRDSIQKELLTFKHLADSVSHAAELPIGWKYSILNKKGRYLKKELSAVQLDSEGAKKKLAWWQRLWKFLWYHVPGFLVSGLAASFGASFWFDLLKKLYQRKPKITS